MKLFMWRKKDITDWHSWDILELSAEIFVALVLIVGLIVIFH